MRSRVAVFKSECKQKLANGELYSREFLTSKCYYFDSTNVSTLSLESILKVKSL